MNEIISNLFLGDYRGVIALNKKEVTGFAGCLSIGSEFVLAKRNNIQFKEDALELPGISVEIPNLNLNGIHHQHFSLNDGSDGAICEIIPKCIEFIDEYLRVGKVYVHCFAGVSRSASVVYSYLLYMGMDSIQAYSLLKSKRPVINPYQGFINEINELMEEGYCE